jgi:2-haloacid dehalogenase
VEPVRVLLFDVFGTLVDWRSSLIGIAETAAARAGLQADWATVVDDWRRAYQPAMDKVRHGAAWRDLDALQHETLADVLARHGIPLLPAGRESLVRGWRQLSLPFNLRVRVLP